MLVVKDIVFWLVDGEDIWYSQPYRYTDYRGRFDTYHMFYLGYTPNEKYHIDNNYDLNKFPTRMAIQCLRSLYFNNERHVI